MVEVVEATIDDIEAAIFELNSGAATKEASESAETPESGDKYSGQREVRRTVWLDTTFLRSRLQIWNTQLRKMVEHVDELSSTGSGSYSERISAESGERAWEDDVQIKRTGLLIKDRLKTLIEEIEEKIEECSMGVDGMTIATQWVRSLWSSIVKLFALVAGPNRRRLKAIPVSTLQARPDGTRARCGLSPSLPWCFFPVHSLQ